MTSKSTARERGCQNCSAQNNCPATTFSISSVQEEMTNQDENFARINKERKRQEEINRKMMEDLQSEEDKVSRVQRLKVKLEQQLDDEDKEREREKRIRQDLEKAKRKTDDDLKVALENAEEIIKQKHDVELNFKKKETDLQMTSSKLNEEMATVGRLPKQVKDQEMRCKVSMINKES
ncbi:hypothetical protein AB6A40_000377 [Gnathostoma spinigerum]|uniref:Myosin tail domain-containing protein n=1 Tax=Gnathostoma spinigerum TaxID=75299 RepID=A0ABD6E226_9BILA